MLKSLFRKQTKLQVRVNTHPWAWLIPMSAPVDLPGVDLEVTDTFRLNEAGVRNAVAILRENFSQASFTPARWQGTSAWDTQTFDLAEDDTEEAKAFLARLEQAHQEILLSAQSAYNRLHPEG